MIMISKGALVERVRLANECELSLGQRISSEVPLGRVYVVKNMHTLFIRN